MRMAVGRGGHARDVTRRGWPGVFFVCSLLALLVCLIPATAPGKTDSAVTNDQLVDDIISTLQFGRPSTREAGGLGDSQWLIEQFPTWKVSGKEQATHKYEQFVAWVLS